MKETRKYQFIDCLRGHAILGVVFVHCQVLVDPEIGIIRELASSGARGVQLFFLVSALTLGLSAGSRLNRNEPAMWRSFFVRRLFRIAPMFYLAIAYYFIFGHHQPWDTARPEPNVLDATASALFINNWFPRSLDSIVPGGWSVAVEMMFYITFPLIWLKIKTPKMAMLFAVIAYGIGIGLKEAVRYAYPLIDPDIDEQVLKTFAGLWLPSQFFVFLLGHGLYLLLKDYLKQREHDEPLDNRIGLRFITGGAALFVVLTLTSTENFVYAIAMSLWVYGLARRPVGALVNPFFALIGKISYSLYLTHFMAISWLLMVWDDYFAFVPDGPAGYLLGVVCTLVIGSTLSWGTYQIFEKPGIAVGKKLIDRLNKDQTPPATYAENQVA